MTIFLSVQLLMHDRVYSAPAAPCTYQDDSFGDPGGADTIVDEP